MSASSLKTTKYYICKHVNNGSIKTRLFKESSQNLKMEFNIFNFRNTVKDLLIRIPLEVKIEFRTKQIVSSLYVVQMKLVEHLLF